jgi:hypothetical protein
VLLGRVTSVPRPFFVFFNRAPGRLAFGVCFPIGHPLSIFRAGRRGLGLLGRGFRVPELREWGESPWGSLAKTGTLPALSIPSEGLLGQKCVFGWLDRPRKDVIPFAGQKKRGAGRPVSSAQRASYRGTAGKPFLRQIRRKPAPEAGADTARRDPRKKREKRKGSHEENRGHHQALQAG